MPWQIVPPLLIIGGAFAATGLLLNGFDYVTTGRVSDKHECEFLFILFVPTDAVPKHFPFL